MPKKPTYKASSRYLQSIDKPLWQLSDEELHEVLDVNWYPRANDALEYQRRIWDYSYLAYKGIMLDAEINRKRRQNGYGLYVNVPRTFMTIEGIRRNFNINRLAMDIASTGAVDHRKKYAVKNMLNYDLDRSGTKKQVKDAGFNKLLFGNGFLYTFLLDSKGKYGNITGKIDEATGRVKADIDKSARSRYYGMVSRSESPYNIFPDPDGNTTDVDDHINRLCNFHCIRKVKHIMNFKRDWRGILPDKILDSVEPGGKDMQNYECVREAIDYLFDYNHIGNTAGVREVLSRSGVKREYASNEYVEERLWIGEDFIILQAGKGLPFLLVSPNPNPDKRLALTKLDDVRIPGEYWSMGQPYILRYQQIEENRVHNSILDMVHFAISGMLGINSQYLEDKFDTEVYPGKVWKFKAIPGMKISDVMQSFQPSANAIAPALRFLEDVKKTGQSTTAITDFVTGASKSIAGTATEANKLSGASDVAIIEKIREMVEEAFVDVCKNMLAQYPIAYDGKKIELASNGEKIYFFGTTKEKVSEAELAEAIGKYGDENIIFKDELDISNPQLSVIGEIEMSKEFKLAQYQGAIDLGTKINELAYSTGDPRRIDVVSLGLKGMESFEIITDPREYLMEEQPTKMDEMSLAASLGSMPGEGMGQGAGGGQPKKMKMSAPQSPMSKTRQEAQPTNRGMNQSSKKNQ